MNYNTFLDRIFSIRISNKTFIIIAAVTISFLSVELLLSNISLATSVSSYENIVIFVLVAIMFIVGQHLIFAFLRNNTRTVVNKSTSISLLAKAIIPFQYFLVAIILFIIFQMLVESRYSTWLLTLGTLLGYSIGASVMGLLCLRFFLWYKSSKNFALLLYGLATATITIRLLITLVFFTTLLLTATPERTPSSDVFYQEFEEESPVALLNYSYTASSSVGLLLMWISTVILLRDYYSRSWSIKYWIIVAIIPIYSLSDYFITDEVVAGSIGFDTVNYYIFITFQGIVAGILLSIPFWAMGANLRTNSVSLGDYMSIAALGIILFFMASSLSIDHAPYPPFGFILLSSIGLSAYMIMTGVYSSAVAVSIDTELRRFIRISTEDRMKLIDTIGLAEVNRGVQTKVEELSEKLIQESGIESSLDDQQIRDYIAEVVEELERTKFRKGEGLSK
jgi:drug/metabolite transporter superfamily protein YnfA